MNYINQLQQENKELLARIEATREELRAFREHLYSDKFKSIAAERKDWIATGDVLVRLAEIGVVLNGAACPA